MQPLELTIAPRILLPFSREWDLETSGPGSAVDEMCVFERPSDCRGTAHQAAGTNLSFPEMGAEAQMGSRGQDFPAHETASMRAEAPDSFSALPLVTHVVSAEM